MPMTNEALSEERFEQMKTRLVRIRRGRNATPSRYGDKGYFDLTDNSVESMLADAVAEIERLRGSA